MAQSAAPRRWKANSQSAILTRTRWTRRGELCGVGSRSHRAKRVLMSAPSSRWKARSWGRRTQRGSAVRTIDIADADEALATWATRAKFATAARAEVESRLNGASALRTSALQRMPQKEVKNDAESIRNDDGHNCPERWAHASPFRVAIYVAEDQQKTTQHQSEQKSHQQPCPTRWRVGMPRDHNIE